VLGVLVVLADAPYAEERAVGVGVAVDDEIARPLLGIDERLDRWRRVLARERVDELDRRRLKVEVGEVDPDAGGHGRDRLRADR
jgi:hypothetical protein